MRQLSDHGMEEDEAKNIVLRAACQCIKYSDKCYEILDKENDGIMSDEEVEEYLAGMSEEEKQEMEAMKERTYRRIVGEVKKDKKHNCLT